MRPLKTSNLILASLAAMVLAACGGGDGAKVSKIDGSFSVDGGIAQKGPMAAGSKVSIDELISSTFASAGTSYNLQTTGDLGNFDTSALRLSRQYIKTYVSGYYRNELTGELANDQVTLMAYSNLDSDRLVNVNLLTTLAGPRIEKLVRDTTSKSTYRNFGAARDQAEKEVLAAFRIYNSADLMPGGQDSTKTNIVAGNFNEIDLSKSQVSSQILAALSAVAVKAGTNGAGISEFIADFQADLVDNGQIDSAVRAQIDTASSTTSMSVVAASLKKWFPSTALTADLLSPWVDSSGGVDKVINKYKFSAGNVALSTVSKSPVYTIGVDDVGQCFSVGGVTTGATAGLYYNSAASAVTGTQMVKAGDSVAIGLSASTSGAYTGFIQRSAPVGGRCPSAAPTSGQTRVGKYVVDVVDRGALIDAAAVVYTYTAAAIDAGPLKSLTGAAKCDVKVVPLNYKTIGVNGENANASGVLMLPSGANCTGAAGLVAYAKGTDVQKARTLANPADGETFLLAAFYAAQGYAVVATDYLGFAKSTYSYHPYLHADSEASSVIDSIRAARRAATNLGSSLSGNVMLTGYSQGGHSSMAAHRAIERDNANEINVVAGAHLAGPYNMSGSLKSEAVIAGYQFFVPYLVTAWQKVYGNVYTNVTDVFKAPYSDYIENLLPSAEYNYTTLITSGKLPYGPSPTEARDAMFKLDYLTASRSNNNSGLMMAGKKNDLLGWSPKSKLLLCGGAGDPTVPPALHQAPMKADFDSRNLKNVTSVDVDANVRAVYGINGAAPSDPTSAAFATYYGSYHGTYEPPFCHAQAKALFDSVNAK